MNRRRNVSFACCLALLILCPVLASALLPAPEILLPPQGKQFTSRDLQDGKLVLKWASVPGAISFFIQVDGPPMYDPDDENKGNGMFDVTVYGYQYTFSNTTLAGDYTWRVQARDSEGTPGAWSEPRTFEILSSLSLPTDTPTVFVPNYDLNDDLRLDYLDFLCFARGEWRESGSGLLCDTNRDGTVDQKDLLGALSKWTDHGDLPTPTPTSSLQSPVLTSPVNGSIIYLPKQEGQELSWSPVTGAVMYRLVIEFDGDYLPFMTDVFETAETSLVWPRNLSPGLVQWSVVPIESDGRRGAASQKWSFTIASTPPTLTPTATPTELPDPDVTDDGLFDSSDFFVFAGAWNQTNQNGSFDPRADVSGDGTVGPEDLLLLMRSWDGRAPSIFPPVQLSTPRNGSSIFIENAMQDGLKWKAVPGAKSYQVYMVDPTGNYPTDRIVTTTSMTFTPVYLGRYEWKVRVHEPEVGPWSNTWFFYFIKH